MVVNTELTAGEKASFIVLYMSNVTATQWVYMACQHSGIECHFQQKPLLLLPFQECIMIYWVFIIKSTFKTLELLQSFKRKVFPWHFPDKDMVQSLDHCYLKNKKLPHQKTKQNVKVATRRKETTTGVRPNLSKLNQEDLIISNG